MNLLRTGLAMMAVVGACGLAVPDANADDTNADAYVQIAVARAMAEKALRQDATLYDGGRSGWNETWSSVEATWEHINRTQEQAIQREESKEEDRRDANYLYVVRQKREQSEQAWRDFQKKRAAMQISYEDCQHAFARISEIFDGTADLERRWKDAGLDLTVLERMYATLSRRLGEARAKVTQALADATAAQAQWGAALQDAKAAVR